MVVAYQLIDSQIQLEFLESDEPFSRTFAPIAGFAKKPVKLKKVVPLIQIKLQHKFRTQNKFYQTS